LKTITLILCLLAFLFTFSTQTFAIDFTVNTTNDLPDATIGDGNCLTTAGDLSALENPQAVEEIQNICRA